MQVSPGAKHSSMPQTNLNTHSPTNTHQEKSRSTPPPKPKVRTSECVCECFGVFFPRGYSFPHVCVFLLGRGSFFVASSTFCVKSCRLSTSHLLVLIVLLMKLTKQLL